MFWLLTCISAIFEERTNPWDLYISTTEFFFQKAFLLKISVSHKSGTYRGPMDSFFLN